MIRGWLAAAGSVVIQGPVLALFGAFAALLFGLACYGWGRREALREVDEGRAAVSAAVDAAKPQVRPRVPGQRGGGR